MNFKCIQHWLYSGTVVFAHPYVDVPVTCSIQDIHPGSHHTHWRRWIPPGSEASYPCTCV